MLRCAHCGRRITRRPGPGRPARFCRASCRAAAHRGRPLYRERRCRECRREFYVPAGKGRHGTPRVFCTAECRRRFKASNVKVAALTARNMRRWRERFHVAPTDYTRPERSRWVPHEGRYRHVQAVVHSCPLCGSTVHKDDDGAWLCDRCPWWWSAWADSAAARSIADRKRLDEGSAPMTHLPLSTDPGLPLVQ